MKATSEIRHTDEPWDAAQRERQPAPAGSVPQLLRLLTSEITTLFSKEVSLARAEMREAVHGIKTGLIAIVSGAIVLLAGLVVLLMAAVYGLASRMELWQAALSVGGAASLIGLIMFASGKRKLSAEALKPDRTVQSLKEDRAAMQAAVAGGRP